MLDKMEFERDYFPLTVDQNVIVRWAAGLNLAVRVDIDSELDEALFQKAIQTTVRRLPYCRCRLHDNENGETVQYISDETEQKPVTIIDASKLSDEKIDKMMVKWDASPFPNRLRDTQLYQVELLRCRDGKHSLYFCGNHMIMDIYALIFAVTYLDKVYYAMKNGLELPREGASPKAVAAERAKYVASDKCRKDIEWWHEACSTEPLFTSLNGPGGKEYVKGKRYGHDRNLLQLRAKEKIYRIPAELADKINLAAKSHNQSPYMYYALPVRTFLGRVCGTEDVSFQSMISLRASLAHKSSGLSRAAGINFRSVISEEKSFTEAVQIMDMLNKDYLKHAEAPDPNYIVKSFHGCPVEDHYQSFTLSYVPFIDYKSIHLSVRVKKIEQGVSITPVYALIMPCDASGDMYAIIQYAVGYIQEENIERVGRFMLKFIEMGIANPDMTIKELTDACM